MEEDREELVDQVADLYAQNLTGSYLQVGHRAFTVDMQRPLVGNACRQHLPAPDQGLSKSGISVCIDQHEVYSPMLL